MPRKAPGKYWRKGMSLIDITAMFPNDKAAEEWFAHRRWCGEPDCPDCGSMNVQSNCRHNTMPYRCREKDCGKKFSVKTGTIMEASNLGYQTWAMAIYLLTTNLKGVSSMKLHRDLGVTQKTAWYLAHRIRRTWEAGNKLYKGPVEVDETYIGGRETNKHKSKKLNAGRGTIGKTAVIGVKDRHSNQVNAEVIESSDKSTLHGFVIDNARPKASVYTDDASAYQGLPFDHQSIKHSVGEYVKDMAHTNGIESFWVLLKRGYHGTYHHMSKKHLGRYVTEFAGRNNVRPSSTVQQMERITKGMLGRRIKYVELIAN